MKIDGHVADREVAEIVYFSPVEVGDERYHTLLYFQTDIYNRQWPEAKVEQMQNLTDQLRQVELGIHEFTPAFQQKHQEVTLAHNKMALAYLDMREARTAMNLLEVGEPATRSRKFEFHFLRVITLNNLACAYRRLRFFEQAFARLQEAVELAENSASIHPLLAALTQLNFSSVCNDLGKYEVGLKYGLLALRQFYESLETLEIPMVAKAYYVAMACHNAALVDTALGEYEAAIELVENGIEIVAKHLKENDDGLRNKLIVIGAKAKHVPELFWHEAVNAINGDGTGPEREQWNLAFWDFGVHEVREVMHVLQRSKTLKHLLVDEPFRKIELVDHVTLIQFTQAVVLSKLDLFTICKIDFDPKKVWKRIRKRSFLETSWYATTTNYQQLFDDDTAPAMAKYEGLVEGLHYFAKKLVIFLCIMGNVTEGVDLSNNGLDTRPIRALVSALRARGRPQFSVEVKELSLRRNALDAAAAAALALTWKPDISECEDNEPEDGDLMRYPPRGEEAPQKQATTRQQHVPEDGDVDDFFSAPPSVTSLDISDNTEVKDEGFVALCSAIAEFPPFASLGAENIGLSGQGCGELRQLRQGSLEYLALSRNRLGDSGVEELALALATDIPVDALGKVQMKVSVDVRNFSYVNDRLAEELEQNEDIDFGMRDSKRELATVPQQHFLSLKTLCLEDCDITVDGANCLAWLLVSVQSLKTLSLNRNALQDKGANILSGGIARSCLQKIGITYNNITKETAAVALAQAIMDCTTLLDVDLSGNQIVGEALEHLGKAVAESFLESLTLKDMGCSEDHIDWFLDGGAADSQRLQALCLSSNPICDLGLRFISECMTIGLVDLSLSTCSITHESHQTLVNLLSLSPNLTSLDLSHNQLGPSAMRDTVDWMEANEDQHSLRYLNLNATELGDEGFEALVPILRSIDELHCQDNNISSAGIRAVVNGQMLIQLSVLDLDQNHIGEDGIHALTERFQQEHKRSLWNPRQLTSNIDRLILAHNDIPEAVQKSTDTFLKIHLPLMNVEW